ncbi:MAG TPA: tetratricopeptide repeat protein, partial [Chryseosolibacter sp.]|nr:tetratricopeptide repeat protein [Chryseosolibacter sp.]
MYRLLYLILFSFLALPAVAQKIPLVNSGEVIERGKVHYDSGDYADAIKEFQKVPERDTNYVLMLAESALAHLAAQQYDEALAVCEKGLGKPSPYAPSFYRYRAIAEDKKGNLDKSVKLFHEAIEKYPADYGLL